jgi:peptide/nickel transport system ATP-binding protein
VLNLMQDLQERYGLSYLLVSHDLAVVHLVCHDVMVLQGGRMVEQGPTEAVVRDPQHPYTQALLAAVPGHNSKPFLEMTT